VIVEPAWLTKPLAKVTTPLNVAVPLMTTSPLMVKSSPMMKSSSTNKSWNVPVVLNEQNVTTSYTLPSGENATSCGPIYLNSGVTVTIGTGENWSIV